jgi:hypothetical protein
MFTLLKLACLATYALALASLAGLLPAGAFAYAHSRHLAGAARANWSSVSPRRQTGPLAISMILTLLFGLLHWKPLLDAKARDDAR